VFETDAPVRYRVMRDSAGELRVRLEATASPRRVGSKSEVLREVAVESEGSGSVARLALQRGEVDVREMVLENPPRIVLDLTPRAAAPTAVAERATPRAAASEPRRPEPKRAPAEAPRGATVARSLPAVPAPAPASEPAETRPTPTATSEASPTPKADAPAPAPAPEVATVREAPEVAEVPAPEVARAPVTAPPAPASEGSGTAEPAREAPLELQLVSPGGSLDADDPAAARLAKAERDLEKLAGIPPTPREPAFSPPAAEPRNEPEPEPAAPPAEASAAAPTVALAAEASRDAAPPAGGAPGATPGPASDAAPVAALADPRTAAAPSDAAPPAPAAAEAAREEKRAKRARAPFHPTAPVAPSPLAFLPSPFDDPLVLAGIGALLGLIAALALVRRRAARVDDAFASPFDAAESLAADLAGGSRVHRTGTAAFEPVSGPNVAPPTAEMGPLFASATVVADDAEASIFDVTAEEAVGEDVDTPSVAAPPAFEPAAPAFGAMAPEAIDETELTEEEMRLIEELDRRLAHLETRLEEVVDAKERLERHVAAQTEELRVQRAAIARTQRVLRTVVKPDDLATEPVAKP
jgi:hypothetical protein